MGNLKNKSIAELREILDDFEKRSALGFFKVKAEYDSRFPEITVLVTSPIQAVVAKHMEDFDDDWKDYEVMLPSHVLKFENGKVFVDVDEFMWCMGSDYFGSSGYEEAREGAFKIKG